MAENAVSESDQLVRKAPPLSRTLRLLTGSWLLFEVATNFKRPAWETILIGSCTFVAVFVYYAVLHRFIGQRGLRWQLGKAVTIAPVVVVFFILHISVVALGILAFFGVSLLVQALRGDRGCEVMTLPTLVFGRGAHWPCLLFSPLDRLEESIYRAMHGR